jgi:hypothetical protein
MNTSARIRPHRNLLLGVAVALVAATGLTACGSDGTSTSSSNPSASTSTVQKLAITVKGGSVSPTNKRVEVAVDKPLTLTITADAPGELHLHSSPEQHIEFTAGTTTKTVTLKVPGVVELEDHATDQLIAQLEVK